jgi:asparagine synthase (glutamine-hydrolysing)
VTGFFAEAGVVTSPSAVLGGMNARQPRRDVVGRGDWLIHDAPLVAVAGPTPVWSRDRQICVVWDGRLDNGDELGGGPGTPDAQVVAELLATNRDRLGEVIGDFTLFAWWPAELRAWLARDAIGTRPCFYASGERGLFWADTLEAVRWAAGLEPQLNEALFAEYLISAPASLDGTPVVGVHRLPPAHRLEMRPTGQTRTRYWSIQGTEERQQQPGAAVEEFRALFTAAVRARLRHATSPSFQLSGGLDSSSVVGVAARDGGVEHPATYSLVYPELPEADETPFIRDVETFCGARGVHHAVRARHGLGLSVFAGAVQWGDLSEIATGEFITGPMMSAASAAGHDVMFTGFGGDDWLTGSRFRMAAHLRRGDLLSAWRFANEYRSIRWLDPGALVMWRAGVLPNVPGWVKQAVRFVRGPRALPVWFRADFARRVALDDRMRAAFRRGEGIAHPVVRESVVRFLSGDSLHVRESAARAAANAGIELTHPFFDRRLVEFLVALPDDLRLRGNVHRWIQREALGDRLPPRIAARLDKPELDVLVVDALVASEPDALLADLRLAELGWVDRASLVDLWACGRRAPRSRDMGDWMAAFALWRVLAAEALVRGLETRNPVRDDGTHDRPLTRSCPA